MERVVETKSDEDATPEERAIREVNTALLAFDAPVALDALRRVRPDNAQGEVFLPDALPSSRRPAARSPPTSSTSRP